MRNKLLVSAVVLGALVLVGCNVNSTAGTTASGSTDSSTTTSQTGNDTTTPTDACTLIASSDVEAKLGVTGVTSRTSAIGSCNLTNDDGVNVLLQIVAVNLYNPAQYSGASEVAGLGEKAFVQAPVENRSTSQVYKGGKTYIFNVFNPAGLTSAQVQALMTVVMAKS